jgi:hypothetical protein
MAKPFEAREQLRDLALARGEELIALPTAALPATLGQNDERWIVLHQLVPVPAEPADAQGA